MKKPDVNKLLPRIAALNQIVKFTSQTWEQAYNIDQNDVYGEFGEDLHNIMNAIEALQNKAMLEAEKVRGMI
jgi:hypothetical protein